MTNPNEVRRGSSSWKLSLAACAFLAACGVSPETTPTLDIDSPATDTQVYVGPDGLVPVSFSTNYTLKDPGACGNEDACGHVTLLVDGSGCNQALYSYNKLAVSSPTEVDLTLCQTVAGMHTIKIELRKDDGSIVNDAAGNPVDEEATITAEEK